MDGPLSSPLCVIMPKDRSLVEECAQLLDPLLQMIHPFRPRKIKVIQFNKYECHKRAKVKDKMDRMNLSNLLKVLYHIHKS